jgi:hypothetical protein
MVAHTTPVRSSPAAPAAPGRDVSDRRLAANRANARLSTGPRTDAGKAASSRNAVTHGLYCRDLLLPGEDAGELAALRDGLVADVRPRGAAQELIVEQLVAAAWRLRRARAAEGALLADQTGRMDLAAVAASPAAVARRRWDEQVDDAAHLHPRRPLHGPPPDPAAHAVPAAAALAALLRADDVAGDERAGHAAVARLEDRLLRAVHRCLRELRLLRKDARELTDDDDGGGGGTAEPVEPVEPVEPGGDGVEDAEGAGVGEETVAATSPGRNEATAGDGDVRESAADGATVRNEPNGPPAATPPTPADPPPAVLTAT